MSLQERACRDFNILHSVDGCEKLSARFEFFLALLFYTLFFFFLKSICSRLGSVSPRSFYKGHIILL